MESHNNGSVDGSGDSAAPEIENYSSSDEAGVVSASHDGAYSHGRLSCDKENITRREETARKRSVGKISAPCPRPPEREKVLKLSAAKIHEHTSWRSSLPLRPATPTADSPADSPPPLLPAVTNGENKEALDDGFCSVNGGIDMPSAGGQPQAHDATEDFTSTSPMLGDIPLQRMSHSGVPRKPISPRPTLLSRTVSTPARLSRGDSYQRNPHIDNKDINAKPGRKKPAPLALRNSKSETANGSTNLVTPTSSNPVPSPMPRSIPLPTFSISAYLQLELSSHSPSPLYIHSSVASEFPYESSQIKFERLLNFLLLPPELERILWFGALACLDAWLYTFTILPLRFLKAFAVLSQWWARNAVKEAVELAKFVYRGLGRVLVRQRRASASTSSSKPHRDSRTRSATFPSDSAPQHGSFRLGISRSETSEFTLPEQTQRRRKGRAYRHLRTSSTPSLLTPSHKADLLKGLLIVASCAILTRFDASRMYHGIRGQAAIKLYVIYNVLEVCDRLFSAIGQDVLECLFCRETLERDSHGRSKIMRAFWMFMLALAYTVIHSTALFYQVITLNVAVNSYSNALLTLLMSNQFVEIKGTVFKKFEKENLFQLTCADVVERFQLWLMLMIIALRNIVEVGGLSISSATSDMTGDSNHFRSNTTSFPIGVGSIIPKSFTLFPKWTGQVMGPFLLVLGSEMLVDWLKHAYITKFNNTKPAIYSRFLDILAKDYYSNAFADQNLTKRLGLPVIPLSCLFIRASMQTYRMLVPIHVFPPLAAAATSTPSLSSAATSPTTAAALAHIDRLFRRAPFLSFLRAPSSAFPFRTWSLSSTIAFCTLALLFLTAYLILLAFKLLLGMFLLRFARARYAGMKAREAEVVETAGRRVGGWGVVEVDRDKIRAVYEGDPEGLRAAGERERRARERGGRLDGRVLEGISRYSMAAKRIW